MSFNFIKRKDHEIVLLLLSDLHITQNNIEKNDEETNNVLQCLNELSKKLIQLKRLDVSWGPRVIVVAGDLTDRDNQYGYNLLKDYFLEDNLNNFFDANPDLDRSFYNNISAVGGFHTLKSIESSKLEYIICPGNHDLGRVDEKENEFTAFLSTYLNDKNIEITMHDEKVIPSKIKKISDKIDYLVNFEKDEAKVGQLLFDLVKVRFKNYLNFLASINKLDKIDNLDDYYNVCRKQFQLSPTFKITFYSFNSSWCCKLIDKTVSDLGQLYIGKNQINGLLANQSTDDQIIVSLIHHPWYWLNKNEWNRNGNYLDLSFNKISEVSHLVLCGHEHGPVNNYRLENHNSILISNGVSFDEKKSLDLSCTLIKINPIEKSVFTRVLSYRNVGCRKEWSEMFLNNKRFDLLI